MSESLGRILEKARRDRGTTLAEAEADTRIRARLLEALEKGQYESLPSPAYVKGYLISYAKFLDLDPAPLIELYERETGLAESIERPRLPDQVVPPRGQSNHLPLRMGLVVVGLIAAVGLVAWGVTSALRSTEEPPPIPPVAEETPTVDPVEPGTTGPGAPEPPDPAEDEDVPEEEDAGPFALRVEIAPDSASWIRVTVDDLIAYEGTMAGGQSQEWQVAEGATLRIGRPSAVTVYRDGQQVEIPAGDPPTLELSADE